MDVFLSTRMIVKSYGPVGALMVMVKECTDHMDNFDIQRAPTIGEDGHLFKSDGQIRYTTSPLN